MAEVLDPGVHGLLRGTHALVVQDFGLDERVLEVIVDHDGEDDQPQHAHHGLAVALAHELKSGADLEEHEELDGALGAAVDDGAVAVELLAVHVADPNRVGQKLEGQVKDTEGTDEREVKAGEVTSTQRRCP